MIEQGLIKQARQTNLVAYLLNRGEPLKRIGKNYTHKNHDSLFIKDNMFIWYSKQKQGNSIDFLMLYYGMKFDEAVKELTGTILPTIQQSGMEYKPPQATQRASNEKRVIAYLCKKRGLKNSLVFALIKQGKLYQDTKGNCNFVICDWNEQPIGAEIVGTTDIRYKQITVHSGYGFHIIIGQPKKALYFESAIDLLSCYQIFQHKFTEHILISMGGLNNSVILELKTTNPNLEHWLCVDNDTSGNHFISEIKQHINDIHTFKPPQKFKDWNEWLLSNKIT